MLAVGFIHRQSSQSCFNIAPAYCYNLIKHFATDPKLLPLLLDDGVQATLWIFFLVICSSYDPIAPCAPTKLTESISGVGKIKEP